MDVVSFRITDAFRKKLLAVARHYGWSKGQAARFLAQRGLGVHAADAAADAEVWRVLRGVRANQAEINDEIASHIREVARRHHRGHEPLEEIPGGPEGLTGTDDDDNVIEFVPRGRRRGRRGRRGGGRR